MLQLLAATTEVLQMTTQTGSIRLFISFKFVKIILTIFSIYLL